MTGDSWPPPPAWWVDGTDPPDTDPFDTQACGPNHSHKNGPLAGRQPEP